MNEQLRHVYTEPTTADAHRNTHARTHTHTHTHAYIYIYIYTYVYHKLTTRVLYITQMSDTDIQHTVYVCACVCVSVRECVCVCVCVLYTRVLCKLCASLCINYAYHMLHKCVLNCCEPDDMCLCFNAHTDTYGQPCQSRITLNRINSSNDLKSPPPPRVKPQTVNPKNHNY